MPSRWIKVSQQKKYEEHRKRVREARSTIDKQKAPEMPNSMKRESERRRQQAIIERDNRLLLDRLGEAMSRKNIDNVLVPQHFVSYLELQRKKELIKITRDNRRLLERIQNTVPTYHPEEWEKDAEQHVEYLRNMTEFPDYFRPPGSSSQTQRKSMSATRGYSTRRGKANGSKGHSGEVDDKAVLEAAQLFQSAMQVSHTPHAPPLPPIIQQTSSQDERDEEEDDFTRNRAIHLPDIHQGISPPSDGSQLLKRR